ncbi:MAG: 6-carboxytetrahydropterin synthase [Candidatus Sericytochromatia bacterium]|nr:6-carboxytetrahydropterin synthase [Candidatus Sericytochromatia bacterium]
MYRLTRRLKFDAAHLIPNHPGKCARLHGHTYFVDVELAGPDLDELGILVDFGTIKDVCEPLLPDHQYLNDVLPHVPSTAEGLSKYFFTVFREKLPLLTAVTVHEGPNSWCRFEGPPAASGVASA